MAILPLLDEETTIVEDSPTTAHRGALRLQRLPDESVYCACGADTFRLGYGYYECCATCVRCGKKHVVYDG